MSDQMYVRGRCRCAYTTRRRGRRPALLSSARLRWGCRAGGRAVIQSTAARAIGRVRKKKQKKNNKKTGHIQQSHGHCTSVSLSLPFCLTLSICRCVWVSTLRPCGCAHGGVKAVDVVVGLRSSCEAQSHRRPRVRSLSVARVRLGVKSQQQPPLSLALRLAF
jgi:hypothetical protein